MKEHRDALARQIDQCSQRGKALFCLACAERLLGCCWAFQQAYGPEMAAFFRWSDTFFDALIAGSWDTLSVETASRDLEVVIPDSDSYGSPLAVQAQSGVLCVLGALGILGGGGTQTVLDCSNAIVDALDNYTFSVAEKLQGRTESPKMYHLLERECARQLTDAAFLASIGDRTDSALSTWRVENRQYSVPVVVQG